MSQSAEDHYWTLNVAAVATPKADLTYKTQLPLADRDLALLSSGENLQPIPLDVALTVPPHVEITPEMWENRLRLLIGQPEGPVRFLVYRTDLDEMAYRTETAAPGPPPSREIAKALPDDLKVKVVERRGYLVIKTLLPAGDDNFVPYGGSKIGCVLIETDKFLGMSQEAVDLIKDLGSSGDALGDLQLWMSNKGGCFGWLGPPDRLINPAWAELDRNGPVDIPHFRISNEVAPEDLAEIDNAIDESQAEAEREKKDGL